VDPAAVVVTSMLFLAPRNGKCDWNRAPNRVILTAFFFLQPTINTEQLSGICEYLLRVKAKKTKKCHHRDVDDEDLVEFCQL
jgi:hypothetical protein